MRMITLDEAGRYGVDKQDVLYYLDKLKRKEFIIAVTGEFNAGKTCFINCLLNRQDFLPHAPGECTPILLDLFHDDGNGNKIVVKYLDGTETEEEMTDFNIKKYAAFKPGYDSNILSAAIPVEEFPFMENVHIIDTPGTNTVQKEHEDITDYIMNKADLILYVLNKVVSDTDLESIRKIRSLTNNIMFVLTHMDEVDGKTGKKYSEEKIESLVQEAKGQISEAFCLDIEELILLPVGSKEAFADDRYIVPVREVISDYLDGNTQDRMQKLVINQIGNVIEARITALEQEKKVTEASMSREKKELEEKYKKFHAEKNAVENEQKRLILSVEKELQNVSKKRQKSLERLLSDKKHYLINVAAGDTEADTDEIERKVSDGNKEIGKIIRSEMEEDMRRIVDSSYGELIADVQKIVDNFDEDIEVKIEKPDFDTLEEKGLLCEIQKVQREMDDCRKNLESIKNMNGGIESERLESQIDKLESQKIEFEKSLIELGEYMPQYRRIIQDEGKETGGKMGRFLGEAADLILLVWNPASTANKGAAEASKALKAFDKVKDTIKSVQIMKNAMGNMNYGLSAGEREIDGENGLGDTVKRIDNTRRSLRQESTVPEILDLLSLGYWGEKIGEGIGASLKPTRVILEENEAEKEAYNKEKQKQEAKIDCCMEEIRRLKEKLKEHEDDIGKTLRIEKEIRQKESHLQDELSGLEELNRRYKERERKNCAARYYERFFEEVYERQLARGVQFLSYAYEEVGKRLIERIALDYEAKLQEYEVLFDKINKDRDFCDEKIMNYSQMILELKEYPSFIPGWLNYELD